MHEPQELAHSLWNVGDEEERSIGRVGRKKVGGKKGE